MSHFRFTQMNWSIKCVNCKLNKLNCLWHISYYVVFESTHLWPNLTRKTHVMFMLCLRVVSNIDTPTCLFLANDFVSLFIYIKFFEISLFVNTILFWFTFKKSTNKPKANRYIYYHVLLVSYNTFVCTISKILF